jgi:hypothetical protein
LDVTIADMSPDTGVYAVQWVFSGDDFNAPTTMRVASKTFSIPYLWCARSYTLRVFGMNAGWQTSDGFTNQNVTSTSAVFEATMPRCIASAAATTTTVALTCAQGGTCAVGDTGPGGGVVFYVAGSNFTSTGSDCNTTCRYLEVAPASAEVGRTWATDANSNRTTAVPAGATARGIGSGMANTNAIQAQTGNVAASSAAVYAYEYSNGGKTDWHLPSWDELNELCKYARTQTTGDTSVVCNNSGSRRTSFSAGARWSSTENDADESEHQSFESGSRGKTAKSNNLFVHPVRAIG